MARLTIEDCLKHIGNRYDLVLLAARRARELSYGRPARVEDTGNDKPTVLALREIAEGLTTWDDMNTNDNLEDSFEGSFNNPIPSSESPEITLKKPSD